MERNRGGVPRPTPMGPSEANTRLFLSTASRSRAKAEYGSAASTGSVYNEETYGGPALRTRNVLPSGLSLRRESKKFNDDTSGSAVLASHWGGGIERPELDIRNRL